MGCYVNPAIETKEQFLEKNGIQVLNIKWEDVPSDCLPVVLIDNGPFTAAGVAYSKRELEAFTDPRDTRHKKIYIVEIATLKTVSDINRYL